MAHARFERVGSLDSLLLNSMKLHNLIFAAIILLALGGALYWSEHRRPGPDAPKASDASPVILTLDNTAITRVELKQKDTEPIVLVKSASGAWEITQPKPFAADQSNVSSTLSSLSSLTSERVVDDKPSNLQQYGLAPPAVEVDISEKDNKSQKLLLGDDTPTGSAVYVMLAGDPRVFTIASYHKSTIAKSLNDFRDKRLLPVSADQISRLDITRKNQTIEFGRNKEEWQILQPEPLRADNSQVSELVQKLTDAKMDLNETDSLNTASAFASATPVATAKVTGPSGTQELQVRKSKDIYLAKSSAVEGVYKLNADVPQAMDKGVDDFRNKKLFDFGYSDPDKVDLNFGTKSFLFTRTNHDWWLSGKKMDVDGIGSLLVNLRELSADKFVSNGFSNPTMHATVTTDDGKKVEKLSLVKASDGYIAQRENESTLYHLQPSAIDALQKSAEDIKPAVTPSK